MSSVHASSAQRHLKTLCASSTVDAAGRLSHCSSDVTRQLMARSGLRPTHSCRYTSQCTCQASTRATEAPDFAQNGLPLRNGEEAEWLRAGSSTIGSGLDNRWGRQITRRRLGESEGHTCDESVSGPDLYTALVIFDVLDNMVVQDGQPLCQRLD